MSLLFNSQLFNIITAQVDLCQFKSDGSVTDKFLGEMAELTVISPIFLAQEPIQIVTITCNNVHIDLATNPSNLASAGVLP